MADWTPTIKVEIDFTVGLNGTPTTWTNVTQWVELAETIQINRGRSDEVSTADANQLQLVLNNRDGRFTADRPASPYYPGVRVGRPIRVTVEGQVRFQGYVDEWPIEWPEGTGDYASAAITASSQSAYLGFGAELKSTLLEEMERTVYGWSVYFPLTEGEDARRPTELRDRAVLSVAGTGNPILFGQGAQVVTDERSMAAFQAGQYLTGKMPVGEYLPGSSTKRTSAQFVFSTTTAAGVLAEFTWGSISESKVTVSLTADGRLRLSAGWWGQADALVFVGNRAGLADGTMHHVVVSFAPYSPDGPQPTWLFVDGVLTASVQASTSDAYLYYFTGIDSFTTSLGSGFAGTIGSFGFRPSYTSGDPARLHQAHMTGFAGETVSARMARVMVYLGIPASAYSVDTDALTPVERIDTTGRTVNDVLADLEAAEGGVLADSRDGVVTLRSRVSRYNRPTAVTLSVAQQEAGQDVKPKVDRSNLVNDITVTAADGAIARATNQASVDEYGYARSSLSLPVAYDRALETAGWRTGVYSIPRARIPSLQVDLMNLPVAKRAACLAADIGTRVALNDLPGQAAAASMPFIVEGYAETIGPFQYELTFNVSPGDFYEVFELDSDDHGLLDSDFPIAY